MAAPSVYYDIAVKRLDSQMQRIDQLDAKAATVYASSTGILAFVAGLLALTAFPPNTWVKAVVLVTLGLAAADYVWLLFTLYRAYQVGTWHLRPNMTDLQNNCAHYDEDVMKEWVAEECMVSIQDNEAKISNKIWYLKWALIALSIEAALLVIAAGLTLLAK